MKILFITPLSWHIVGFRKKLIEKFQSENYEVSALTFDNKYEQQAKEMNVEFYYIDEERRNINPIKILSLKNRIKSIIKNISPDIVFTFMLKPNTFGVLAVHELGLKNIYSMVEGAGDAFINNTAKWKIIRKAECILYKKSFKYCKKIFFLNNDDKDEFIRRKLVKKEQCEVVHGIGVNLNRFEFKPIKNDKTFLMVARMMKTKGIFEYLEAARIVKKKYPDAIFNYLGAEETVKLEDIKSYIDDGTVNYLGTTSDLRPYYEACTVNVLPSYREGFGLVNAEAGLIGRISITCDTNGTRDTIQDGITGFLIKVKDIQTLVEKMVWCIEHLNEVKKMGEEARKFAEANFDEININNRIFKVVYES